MRHSLAILVLLANFLFADPQGFQLIAGDANAPVDNGAGLTIQSGHQAIIQWDSFSIEEQRMVRFDQLDGNSAVLNRVVGGAESSLMGSLLSNGKVYLVNPNGVLIGPNGRIETAGFIASTADVLNDDFLKGQELLFGDVGPGKIIHLGVIECPTGDVTLLARVIDAPGNIHAGGGTVLLLQPKGASDIFIDTGEECALHQSGRIEALKIELRTSPNPYLKAIRCDGVLEAIEGVEIYAEGGLAELNGAQIHCDSGTVHLLGESVFLNEEVKVDVSGDTQGGTILIGGDYLGQNENIPNADYIFVGSDTVLDARCRQNGNGGKVILWGVKGNHAHGAIHAMGGPQGGDGGFVEISSLGDLRPTAYVSTLAPMGKTGTLLFDPCDVTILAGAGDTGYSGTSNLVFSGSTANIEPSTLQGFLASNNVTIDATASGTGGGNSGTIAVLSPFTWAMNTTLTLIGKGTLGSGGSNASILFSFAGTISNTYSATTANFDALVCTTNNPLNGIVVSSGGRNFLTTYGNMKFTGTLTTFSGGTSIVINNSASFTSNGTGAGAGSFTFTGTASGGFGISVANNTSFSTVDGNIAFIGSTGSIGSAMTFSGAGANSPITISSSGTGTVSFTGSTSSGAGVFFSASGLPSTSPVSVSTNSGSLTLTGVGPTGISIQNTGAAGAAMTFSSATGNVIFDGSGSTGIGITGRVNVTTTSTGNITMQSGSSSTTLLSVSSGNSPSFQASGTGNITFSAPLSVAASTSPTINASAGTVTFNNTINGAGNLSPVGGPSVSFNGVVGGTTALGSLTLPTPTTVCNISANITTTNAITFSVPVSLLTPATTITSNSNGITFGSTLNGANALTLSSSTGTNFNGIVGGAIPLSSLTVNGPVVQTTILTSTTSGNTAFNGAVTLIAGSSSITSTGGAVNFASTLNGLSTLIITSSTGASFGGVVGGGLTPLTSLTVNGPVVQTTTLTSTTINNTTFNGALTLVAGSSSITSTGGAISFASTINGPSTLTIAPSTTASFGNVVGGVMPLAALSVNGTTNQSVALTTTTSGNTTFTGSINATGFPVNLSVTSASTAGNIQVASVTASSITLQPARTFTSGSLGNIPNGIIRLTGNLTATGVLSPISLAAAGRTTTMSIATIASTLSGNNVTISGSSFTVGASEAITVLGNLSIATTTGAITIGDTVALNSLSLISTGSTITVLTHGNESLLNLAGNFYTSPSAHFISGSGSPTTSPAPTGTVNSTGASLSSALLQYAPNSYALNYDTTFSSCLGNCGSSGSGPCSSSTTRAITSSGAIVNQELVANSQLLELLPILSLPIYWPYHGQVCDSDENCESPYFETFSWNNDVK